MIMKDEIQDGFNRLIELAAHISENIRQDKKSLACAQVRKLVADLEVLQAEIEFNS